MQVCEEDARDLLTALGWEGVDGWSPPKLVAKMNVLPVVAEGDRVATLEGSEKDLYDRVIAARQRGEDVVLDSEDEDEEESEDCDSLGEDDDGVAHADSDDDEDEDDGEEEDGVPAATRNGRHPRLKVKRVDPPSRRTVKAPKGKETAKEKAQKASEPKKVRKATPAPARSKTPKYAAKGKSPKVKKKGEDGRGPGIIAYIKTCLQKASEKRPITRERLVERLAKKFPDRDAEAMGRTVRTQVPTQLRYKGFEVYANEVGGFWADPIEETEE